jgi:hypothetical protein
MMWDLHTSALSIAFLLLQLFHQRLDGRGVRQNLPDRDFQFRSIVHLVLGKIRAIKLLNAQKGTALQQFKQSSDGPLGRTFAQRIAATTVRRTAITASQTQCARQ